MVNIGIDIGTSNTVVSFFENGEPVAYRLDTEDSVLVPSVVYIEEQAGRTEVGTVAVQQWADPAFDPASSFRRWKLRMGEDVALGELALGGGKKTTRITPKYLTSRLVEHVVKSIAEGVGGRTVDSVVVTVPHGWRRERPEGSQATRDAAAEASVAGRGLPVREVTLSEPVAAASYWLWEARRSQTDFESEFVGKTVLVVDIGGGTFDLSLVRVGTATSPLVVINAINNDVAGDFATALVLGRATALANEQFGTDLPTDAAELLALLADGSSTWVRSWFLDAQEIVRKMSLHIRQGDAAGRTVAPHRATFELEQGEIRLQLSREDFETALEPFYARSRELLAQFLDYQSPNDLPHAIVFAGGGSRITGIADRIVTPVLASLVADAPDRVARIEMNAARIDQAVSLGAALVAEGEVVVEERLLYDVGLEVEVQAEVARELGLGDETRSIVVSPILPRSTPLPATADIAALIGSSIYVARGEEYNLTFIVFDDPADPHVQGGLRRHLSNGDRTKVNAHFTADTDGRLTVRVETDDGTGDTVIGFTSRAQARVASLTVGVIEPAPKYDVVTPEELRRAATAAASTKKGGTR